MSASAPTGWKPKAARTHHAPRDERHLADQDEFKRGTSEARHQSLAMPKPIIGIIGSIGAGKSVVSEELARRGGALIVADALGHEGLRQPAIKAEVVARWGSDLLRPDGEIDRRKLGAIVFADAKERIALEGIQFPYIGRRVREEIDKAQSTPSTHFVVLDAAVLLEAGWRDVCDFIVFVDAPREVRLERLQTNRKWTESELENRERSQMPLEEKRRAANAVLINAGSLESIVKKVEELIDLWNLLPEKE